jgi:hypothetical protein
MKSGLIKAAALLWSVSLIICGTGCHSTGYKKADVAGKGLQTGAAEVQTESQALQQTMQALDNLVNHPAPDLKPQFVHFSHSLDWLNTCAKRTDATAKRIEKKNAAYLAAWNKQLSEMTYDYIRNQSEARKNEVTQHLEAVDQRYTEAQSAVQPLIDYLEDIRRALSIDLTAGGLEAAKPIVAKAGDNAGKLQTALANLAGELNDSGARISTLVEQHPTPQSNSTPEPAEVQRAEAR